MKIEITKIESYEDKGFARIFYSDTSSLIVTIDEARELADHFYLLIHEV